MCSLDDRILEHLNEESWSSPAVMESHHGFRVPASSIRDGCRIFADAELVAIIHDDAIDITNWGQFYWRGKIDAQTNPHYKKKR